MGKAVLRLSGVYAVLLVLFTTAIIAVHLIPTSAVRANVASSAATIEDEGVFFRVLGCPLWQIDNMTDCMMFNMNVYADSDHPVDAAMLNRYGYDEHGPQGYKQLPADTRAVAQNGNGATDSEIMYGRYWQGYQVVLRPLLTFMDYDAIRTVNYLLLFFLAGLTTFLIAGRAGWPVSMLFVVSLLAAGFHVVPLAIQFSTCFYIAFIASIVVLMHPQIAAGSSTGPVFFFVTGAVTSYADFLTTPQITLGLPLICVFLTGMIKRKKCLFVIKSGLIWLVGYASLWASKWFVAGLLTGTGTEVLESAVDSFVLRTSDDIYFGGEKMPISRFFSIMVSALGDKVVVAAVMFAVLIVVAFGCYLYRCRRNMDRYGYLLLIAAMVPAWYLMLRNHSLQHVFFTWRALSVTIFSLLLFIYYNKNNKTKLHE